MKGAGRCSMGTANLDSFVSYSTFSAYIMCLQVDHTRKFLNAVQEQISLLDHFPVVRILQIRSRRHNDTTVLVNLGRQAVRRDEATRVVVDEIRRNTKGARHGRERDALVAVEELLVSEDF